MLEDFKLPIAYKVNSVYLWYGFLKDSLISLESDWGHVVVDPLKSTLT